MCMSKWRVQEAFVNSIRWGIYKMTILVNITLSVTIKYDQ